MKLRQPVQATSTSQQQAALSFTRQVRTLQTRRAEEWKARLDTASRTVKDGYVITFDGVTAKAVSGSTSIPSLDDFEYSGFTPDDESKLDNIATQYDDVTEFLASTDTLADDTYVGTKKEGFSYKAVPSGGDVANAFPQSFDVQGWNNIYPALAYNPNADGVTDDSTEINNMNVAGRVVDLGGKDYEYNGTFTASATFINGRIIDDAQTFNYQIKVGLDTGSATVLDDASSPALPIGPISFPNTFNNTLNASIYWDGSKIQYDSSPYDLIDFTKYDTVNDYYVNYAEGDNANSGTSTGSGNSWKTLDYAIANSTSPAVIHLEDDLTGYLSSGSSVKPFTGKLKIKGEGVSGRTIIAAMRESYDVASFSWSASGSGGAFVSTTASAKKYRCMLDGNYRNVKGLPRPMTSAADQATCETTSGTFFYDSGTTFLYVNMFDGRTPDPDDGWLYGESPYDFEIQQGGTTSADVILLENLEFVSNNGAVSSGATLRYRPVTTGSENSAQVGFKNVLTYGGHDNGFEIYDADVVVTQDCHAWYNRNDGLNYHSFITTGTRGEYMTVYEHNCTAQDNAWEGWDDQQSLSTSTNASTAHDGMHILRTNTVGGSCNGAVIADVNGVHSLNYFVQASQPDARGSAGFNGCFWHEKFNSFSTIKIMYLWGCIAHDDGDTDVQLITNEEQGGGSGNAGEVRVKYWRGQTDGSVTGQLYDFDGNPI